MARDDDRGKVQPQTSARCGLSSYQLMTTFFGVKFKGFFSLTILDSLNYHFWNGLSNTRIKITETFNYHHDFF
jgi:succinate dehydrogenase hydrophobic anchor subunit